MASVELIAGNPIVVYGVEHATDGAWQIGDLLKIGSNGKWQLGTTGLFYGIARTNANGAENTVHEIELISFKNVYSVRYSAATSVALIGDGIDFTFTTVGAQPCGIGGADADGYIVALDTRDPVGTVGGRVWVKFLTALGDAAF